MSIIFENSCDGKIINKDAEWEEFEYQAFQTCSCKRKTHVKSALLWYGYSLLHLYQNLSISLFLKSTFNVDENIRFANALVFLLKNKFKWKNKATIHRYFAIIKQFLSYYNSQINIHFLNTLKLKLNEPNFLTVYSKKNNEQYPFLKDWVTQIQIYTSNKSLYSIKNVMLFLIKTCKQLNIDISNPNLLQQQTIQILPSVSIETWYDIFKNQNYFNTIHWFKIFLTHIVKIDNNNTPMTSLFPESLILKNCKKNVNKKCKNIKYIESHELDQIFKQASTSSIHDELCFLLLITTGMRVSALTKIELKNICCVNNNSYEIFDEGKTIEKNRVWFDFPIIPRVKYLLLEYITKKRPSLDTLFLFPGRQGNQHVSTLSISRSFQIWCKKANLVGKQFHIHSLRHCFAKLVWKSGNNFEIVSKLMGHNKIETTTKHYLQEDATDILQRTNIPWIQKPLVEKKNNIVPDFLQDIIDPHQSKKQKFSDISMFF